MKKSTFFNQKGFTLIEIISVLIILGILAAVAVPKYIDLQDEARIKAAQSAIAEVKARLSLGYGKTFLVLGTPPTNVGQIVSEVGATVLPATSGDDVPGIGDFTVTLAFTSTDGDPATITVTEVQGVGVTVPAATWEIPSP